MKKVIFLILCTGCVYMPSHKVRTMIEAQPRDIVECQLVGQVHGESEYAYLAIGTQIAKDRALQEASNIGATHVVWSEIDSGIRPLAIGRAYRCAKNL